MNQKKLKVSSNNIKHRHKVLQSYFIRVFTLIFLFIFCDVSMANNENHTVYVNSQAQKTKDIIAPYKKEIEALVQNALAQQIQQNIQAFKKEITTIATTQCSNNCSNTIPNKEPNLISAIEKPELINPTPRPDEKLNTTSVPIFIFVSFSMPKESIKGWIAQAQTIGAAVYIRGLINNSFKDTTKAVFELVKDQPGGLLIDPTLFKKYSITQVPAVVVQDNNHSSSGQNNSNFTVIYGDVTLDCALEKISNAVQNSTQKHLLEAVRKIRNIPKTKLTAIQTRQ